MDFALPEDDDPRRLAVRRFFEEHPRPSPAQIAAAGYAAPHWPRPWGLDADPLDQLIIDEEMRAAHVTSAANPIGIGWAGPLILRHGTDEQRARYLMPILTGDEIWCQLFSEPDAGSDLANLATSAAEDGDVYVVNGSKIWTTGAHASRFGILLARTATDVPKHQGVTYFICPMDLPGVTVRPIRDMTGLGSFNQVFFDDVRIPAANVVGEVNRGWALAKLTLTNERVSLSGSGVIWGMGPTTGDVIEMWRDGGGVVDPVLRQRVAAAYVEAEILRLIRLRTVSAAVRGEPPGPEASVRKALADDHGRRLMNLAKDLAGTAGVLGGAQGMLGVTTPGDSLVPAQTGELAEVLAFGFLFSPAVTIGGGTAQIQRNIIAERVLGLPRDVDAEAGTTWAEAHRPRP